MPTCFGATVLHATACGRMGRAAVGPSYRSSCWLGFYHQYQYGTQMPPRHRRPRRRRRPPRYLRPRYLRPASAGALVAALIAVARVVTPSVVPMVPTALTHQNTAIATAAIVCANSFPGDQGRFIIPFLSKRLIAKPCLVTRSAWRRNGERLVRWPSPRITRHRGHSTRCARSRHVQDPMVGTDIV